MSSSDSPPGYTDHVTERAEETGTHGATERMEARQLAARSACGASEGREHNATGTERWLAFAA